MKLARKLTDLIGNTPLLALARFAPGFQIYAKLESFNPLSSAKDRAAYFIITDAAARGALPAGGTIVEPTSGNMGVGLAYIAALEGYKIILTMPESMTEERKKLLRALGAELVLTPAADGMGGAIAKAKELVQTLPNAFMPNQFENQAGARAHYKTTGPEIWRDTEGKVELFVAGVGSGGTVSGAGCFLKEQNPQIRVVAVEPAQSPVLSGGAKGPHKIAGIGAGFVPGVFAREVVDEIVTADQDAAAAACRALVRSEGLLVGISSGAAACAALALAQRPENKGKMIVAMFPDTGERYLSTPLFDAAE